MNKSFKNLAITPKQCHLWQQPEQAIGSLVIVKKYPNNFITDADESERSLKKCSKCGQLYFYEFLEYIDWQDGNDPAYRTFIPIASKQDADKLSLVGQYEILAHSPRLQIDFPKNAKKPTTEWID
jgi:hypothetical protein